MIRALVAVLLFGCVGVWANGQQAAAGAAETAAATPQPAVDSVDRAELLRLIAKYEDVAQRAEAVHLSDASLVRVYAGLGGMYYDVAMFPKAEDAMRRAIALLRQFGPQDQLAEEIGRLAELHIATGNLHQAEKEHLEELKIRESGGDPVGIALAWTDLAAQYNRQGQYKKAVDYAQRAIVVIGDNPHVRPADRLAIRQILGSALCGIHDDARGIPILKEAITVAQINYGEGSLSEAIAQYILGNAYWRSGDMVDAAAWMGLGITRMKADLGWGHPMYVDAMKNYAQVLRERGQMEAAAAVESEVRQAATVVDARTLTARASAFAGGQPQ